MYKVTFSEFDEIDSLNQKNNYSTSGSSSYMSKNSLFNSLFNFPSDINKTTVVFSSVFLPQESEQHFNSSNVFSPYLF
jgi:hypothetical protein